MSSRFLLGIDTGGTYTDAVVLDETSQTVVAKAKAPTTHDDLAIGIAQALDSAIAAGGIDPSEIELVSLSTTLATNALVEGKGRPVALIIVGFEPEVLARAGLAEAMGNDPVVWLTGGHDSHGYELAPLDLSPLAEQLGELARRVDAFAVTSQFSIRNPRHELAVADLVRERTGRPVTCSHELSAHLNGPKRAVTAVLNARLIAIVQDLVDTTENTVSTRGIDAPLMVVRGDGSLVSARFVRDRPIETILSGPAASLVGAAHLTGVTDAVIADIGGTTTDIAVLRNGVPLVRSDGAIVGGHHTMVSAVAMDTSGLGGDSEVRHDDRAAGPVLTLGPRRVIPLSSLAIEHGAVVRDLVAKQLASETPDELDGIVMWPRVGRSVRVMTDSSEQAALDALSGPLSMARDSLRGPMARRAAARLVSRGVLHVASFTPTDACHVLGWQRSGDVETATLAAELFSRRKDRLGQPLAPDAIQMSRLVTDALVRRSAEVVLGAVLPQAGLPASSVRTPVVQAALDGRPSLATITIGLTVPLVALGASAATYYPAVGALLHADVVVPEHADVANAVGAVVGRVQMAESITISAPHQGEFVVHDGTDPVVLVSLEEAQAHAEAVLATRVAGSMAAAGAPNFASTWDWNETTVDIGGLPLFVEGVLTVTGSGRPDFR